jgi:hypothetical protein
MICNGMVRNAISGLKYLYNILPYEIPCLNILVVMPTTLSFRSWKDCAYQFVSKANPRLYRGSAIINDRCALVR